MDVLTGLAAFWAIVWTVMALFAMTVCVSYERGFFAFVILTITVGLLEWQVEWWSPLAWSFENPGGALALVGGYVIIGVLWSMVKWRVYIGDRVVELKRSYEEYISRWERSNPDIAARPTFVDWFDERSYELTASSSKDRILMWMAWWPLSVVDSIFTDLLGRMWRGLFSMFEGLYDRITRSALK